VVLFWKLSAGALSFQKRTTQQTAAHVAMRSQPRGLAKRFSKEVQVYRLPAIAQVE